MIDLKLLRDNPDAVRRSQLSRGEDPALVDALLEADTARRTAISAADTLRAEQKAASKRVGSASPDERPALLEQAKQLAAQVKSVEADQAKAESAFTAAHMAIPNVVIDGVPPAARTTSPSSRSSANRRRSRIPRTTWNWARACG